MDLPNYLNLSQIWSSKTLATWCKEPSHWKRRLYSERLRAEGEGDDRGWDGWMSSLTQWTRVWVDSGSWWWTGRPGVLWFMGLQRVGHDWATELNWIPGNTGKDWQRGTTEKYSHWSLDDQVDQIVVTEVRSQWESLGARVEYVSQC